MLTKSRNNDIMGEYKAPAYRPIPEYISCICSFFICQFNHSINAIGRNLLRFVSDLSMFQIKICNKSLRKHFELVEVFKQFLVFEDMQFYYKPTYNIIVNIVPTTKSSFCDKIVQSCTVITGSFFLHRMAQNSLCRHIETVWIRNTNASVIRVAP